MSPCTCSNNYPCNLKSSFWSAKTRKNSKFFFSPSRDPIPGALDDASSLSIRRSDETGKKSCARRGWDVAGLLGRGCVHRTRRFTVYTFHPCETGPIPEHKSWLAINHLKELSIGLFFVHLIYYTHTTLSSHK